MAQSLLPSTTKKKKKKYLRQECGRHQPNIFREDTFTHTRTLAGKGRALPLASLRACTCTKKECPEKTPTEQRSFHSGPRSGRTLASLRSRQCREHDISSRRDRARPQRSRGLTQGSDGSAKKKKKNSSHVACMSPLFSKKKKKKKNNAPSQGQLQKKILLADHRHPLRQRMAQGVASCRRES